MKRWVTSRRASGLLVAEIGIPYVIGFIFIINEELFTGMKVLTMHPPSN